MSIQVLDEQTIQEHSQAVRGTCSWLLKGPYRDYVDDVVQETWLKAHRHLEKGNAQTGHFKSWICRIARNASLDFLDKAKKARGTSSLSDLTDDPMDTGWSDFYERNGMVSTYAVIRDFIYKYLPFVCPIEHLERRQRVFYLAVREGFKQNEIASRMYVSPPTINRDIRFLRNEWDKYLSNNDDPGSGPGRGTTLGTTRGDSARSTSDRANRSEPMNAKAMIPASQLGRFKDLVLQLPAFRECEQATCNLNISNLDEILDVLARERTESSDEAEVPGVEHFLGKQENTGSNSVGPNMVEVRKPSGGRQARAQSLAKDIDVGVSLQIGTGKTTTTDRTRFSVRRQVGQGEYLLLFYTGVSHKIGEFHDGGEAHNAAVQMDCAEYEQERGMKASSAATACAWNGRQTDIIDSSEYQDFISEVERSLLLILEDTISFDSVNTEHCGTAILRRIDGRFLLERASGHHELESHHNEYLSYPAYLAYANDVKMIIAVTQMHRTIRVVFAATDPTHQTLERILLERKIITPPIVLLPINKCNSADDEELLGLRNLKLSELYLAHDLLCAGIPAVLKSNLSVVGGEALWLEKLDEWMEVHSNCLPRVHSNCLPSEYLASTMAGGCEATPWWFDQSELAAVPAKYLPQYLRAMTESLSQSPALIDAGAGVGNRLNLPNFGTNRLVNVLKHSVSEQPNQLPFEVPWHISRANMVYAWWKETLARMEKVSCSDLNKVIESRHGELYPVIIVLGNCSMPIGNERLIDQGRLVAGDEEAWDKAAETFEPFFDPYMIN